jgi:ribokinase
VDGAGENVIYVAAGANATARADDVSDERLTKAAAVVCQMEVPQSENWRLLRRAKSIGTRTVLNLAPARDIDAEALAAIRDCVDILVVNREEASQLCLHSRTEVARSDPGEVALHLGRAFKTLCVITLGAEGVCASDGIQLWAMSALPVEVKDTTGAGDTFTGVLTASLAEGRGIEDALTRGSTAASLACQALGAQQSMPRRCDIDLHVGKIRAPAR